MYKSCSRCGRIHGTNYVCKHGTETYDNQKYKRDKDKLRFTEPWKKKSKEIKESANYLCEVCLDGGKYTYNQLEIHHIDKLREAPEKFLENENLVCLCKMHHKLAESGDIKKEYLKHLAYQREHIPPYPQDNKK